MVFGLQSLVGGDPFTEMGRRDAAGFRGRSRVPSGLGAVEQACGLESGVHQDID